MLGNEKDRALRRRCSRPGNCWAFAREFIAARTATAWVSGETGV